MFTLSPPPEGGGGGGGQACRGAVEQLIAQAQTEAHDARARASQRELEWADRQLRQSTEHQRAQHEGPHRRAVDALVGSRLPGSNPRFK